MTHFFQTFIQQLTAKGTLNLFLTRPVGLYICFSTCGKLVEKGILLVIFRIN